MPTLMWIQTGACGGDSMSILCADSPSLENLLDSHKVDLLWHPSLSHSSTKKLKNTIQSICDGAIPLDILCVEGSIVTAPNGSGMYDTFAKQPKMQIIEQLAQKAEVVVAMGTCAAFGGIHAAPPNPSECIGLQFDKAEPGGLLSSEWRSSQNLPVINVSGCPAHPNTMTKTLAMLLLGMPLPLDHLNRPQAFFNTLVHQGCTRNEYHEYDIEEHIPGGRGCMFFNLGCRGPVTQAICNTELWNGRSSKTRVGVPCFGCTSPDFPLDHDLFKTEKLGNTPTQLPAGVERAKYMAYKNLARAAAPERVANKKMQP